MYLTAILLAAGRGLRLKSKTPKPLVNLDSLPMISYSLKKLSRDPRVKDIVVVVNPGNSKSITKQISKHHIRKVKRIVFGGKRRQDSVARGLKALDRRTDLVLIHDAARPFFNEKLIPILSRQALECGAAILGVPVKATVKRVRQSLVVAETLDRGELWEIQTPQVFKKDLILKAYKRFGHTEVTDDASLVEKLGVKVAVVMGSYLNIKITTPEDLVVAKAIA